MRDRAAVEKQIALADDIAFIDRQPAALRQQIFDRFAIALDRHDADAALGLVVIGELDTPFGLGDDGKILRLAGLEQLGNARQTTGDVTRLR